jgi:hypothetical protein
MIVEEKFISEPQLDETMSQGHKMIESEELKRLDSSQIKE